MTVIFRGAYFIWHVISLVAYDLPAPGTLRLSRRGPRSG